MRLFIAANLIKDVKESIRKAIEAFPIADPPWRWLGEEAFHITLKFIGETPEDRIPQILTHLEAACRGHSQFTIGLAELSGFPNLSNPRVLFYRVEEGAERLERLSMAINQALDEGMSISGEAKRFRAHVTIARVKRPIPRNVALWLTEMPDLTGVSQTVSSIDLMSSELRREGARYQLVKEIALEG